MSNMASGYWRDAVIAVLEEIGASIPDAEKLDAAAEVLESYRDNYGMAHGHDCIPDPRDMEIKTLRKSLDTERGKITCSECKGTGWLFRGDSVRSSESQCWKCRGEGRHLP